jgi:hypothetical protein
MPWVIEESDDCGVHWHRAELPMRFLHPRVAMLEALTIIQDEWRPSQTALDELATALHDESIAYYWNKAIRVVQGGGGR